MEDKTIFNNKYIKLDQHNLEIFYAKFQLLDGLIYLCRVNQKNTEKDIIDHMK